MAAVHAQQLQQRDSEILAPPDDIVCSHQGQMMTFSKGPEVSGTANTQQTVGSDDIAAVTQEISSLRDRLGNSIALPAAPIDLSRGWS